MPDRPDPLTLYRLAVQHPLAEVAFIERVWEHYRDHEGVEEPLLLREDFAGTCAVAHAWVQSDPERQAMAIELDAVTATWAMDTYQDPDLHVVIADVMEVYEPLVDVTISLNFSTLIYHDEQALLAYLKHAKSCLNDRGLLILDLFGGEGARRARVQSRDIDPDEAGTEPFGYTWEQRAFDPATARIDCRIHFTLADGSELTDAFCYDWRLWRPDELTQIALQAGFTVADLWSDDPKQPGRYRVMDAEPGEEDWVGYVVLVV